MNNGSRKGITVNLDTFQRFRGFGKYGESYDDILNRLMDIAETRQRK